MSVERDKGAMNVSILGREFRVGCSEGEEKQLLATVEYLNRKMKEVRDTGKVVGNERIAIMAALNIAHELLARRPGDSAIDGAAFRRRIATMQETLASVLSTDQDNLF